MFERPDAGERALLVHVGFDDRTQEPVDTPSIESRRAEFVELARSAGLEVVELITASRKRPDPRHFIGSGKIKELSQAVLEHEADLVLFGQPLSPAQERNLERELKVRVLDRNTLILDIFAQRARSHEGKLQVELAQLVHLSTRLVRGWTHLERQKGGIGLRGPGETQLETDRRLLGQRVKVLRERLEKVRRQRDQGRSRRLRSGVPTVALVGYTNAGKSTLFNRLTDATVLAADQLFATLDPTLRRIELDRGQVIVLADTVGFIDDLPHELVEAFRSTLVETREADLLLHVIDAGDEERTLRIAEVEKVLDEIGAGEQPRLNVMNKIDTLETEAHLERDDSGVVQTVWISALKNQGMELLRQAVSERLGRDRVGGCLQLDPEQGRLRARLHALDAVRSEVVDSSGRFALQVDLDAIDYARLLGEFPELPVLGTMVSTATGDD